MVTGRLEKQESGITSSVVCLRSVEDIKGHGGKALLPERSLCGMSSNVGFEETELSFFYEYKGSEAAILLVSMKVVNIISKDIDLQTEIVKNFRKDIASQ